MAAGDARPGGELMRPEAGQGDDAPGKFVVFVLPALTMGGAEKQILTVLEGDAEARRRHRIEVLTLLPATSPIIERRFAQLGIPVHTIDRSQLPFPSFFLGLWRYFRERRPDLVHTFLAGSTGTWGRLAARLAGVSVLVHSERTLTPATTRLQRLLEPLLIPITTRFITNAEAIAEKLRRSGVPAEKVHVLRNAVAIKGQPEGGQRPLRAGFGVDDDAVVLGFLGMFRPSKRLDLLFDALLLLEAPTRPDLVVLAGDGELRQAVQARVEADPWLSSHVRLLGVVEDTGAFLKSIDVMIMTSDTEGLPNAMLEAMAAGVPCVSTRVSDVPYLLEDERFLADMGDAASIAGALRTMLSLDAEERRSVGVTLRARLEQEFDQRNAARRFWALHDDLWRRGVTSAREA